MHFDLLLLSNVGYGICRTYPDAQPASYAFVFIVRNPSPEVFGSRQRWIDLELAGFSFFYHSGQSIRYMRKGKQVSKGLLKKLL